MKRILAFFLCLAMLLAGCSQPASRQAQPTAAPTATATPATEEETGQGVLKNEAPDYDSLSDEELLDYIEDAVYQDTVRALDSEDYVVENVEAIYISQEYLDEVAFNSQANIYFGYTLSELNDIFQGERYVFTLGEDGATAVQELQAIEDSSAQTILTNVAIGTGVILVCVVVSSVTAGVGAPAAVSTIFAVAAETGTIAALSSGGLSAMTAGITKGYQTGDLEEAIEAAILAGSKSYKWGAITGAISGGAGETFLLKRATKSGLTMSEAARIQRESKLPMDVIKQFHSMDEYLVYKQAGLQPVIVNGRTALVQNIDLTYKSALADGTEVTNLARMQKGLPPLDPATGVSYQLHHIGQKSDATLAVLTSEQHLGNSAILNIAGKESEINRSVFATIKRQFWKALANVFIESGGL